MTECGENICSISVLFSNISEGVHRQDEYWSGTDIDTPSMDSVLSLMSSQTSNKYNCNEKKLLSKSITKFRIVSNDTNLTINENFWTNDKYFGNKSLLLTNVSKSNYNLNITSNKLFLLQLIYFVFKIVLA